MGNIQFDKAKSIYEKHSDEYRANCKHDNILKEYYLGTATGDYVCANCGETFTREEYKNL